jgi:probable F420-dependent oxidoreductase
VPSAPLAIGCTLAISGAHLDPSALGALAQTAEDLGFDSVWVSDHVVIPERIASTYPYSPDGVFHSGPSTPVLEPLSALAYLAGCTRRIRLGTHVLILPYRNPVLTAKIVTTLDNLSGGRIDLGVGVGWMREEFAALGHDNLYERRGAVTDEQMRVMRALWTEELPSFEGEFYRFGPLGAAPRPIQQPHPPLWIGGHTPLALRRVARHGDGWLPIGARPPADLPPDEIAAGIARIRAEAQRVGRDPSRIQIGFSTSVNLGGERDEGGQRRPFQGTPDDVRADLERYRQVGVERFVVNFGAAPAAEYERRLRQFVEQVQPTGVTDR